MKNALKHLVLLKISFGLLWKAIILSCGPQMTGVQHILF